LDVLSEWFLDIETIELPAIPKEQETEHQKRYPSKITIRRETISRLHLFSEMDTGDDDKNKTDHRDIRQKAYKQFAYIVSREKEGKQKYQNYDEYRSNHLKRIQNVKCRIQNFCIKHQAKV
jgi:hypothetical protein